MPFTALALAATLNGASPTSYAPPALDPSPSSLKDTPMPNMGREGALQRRLIRATQDLLESNTIELDAQTISTLTQRPVSEVTVSKPEGKGQTKERYFVVELWYENSPAFVAIPEKFAKKYASQAQSESLSLGESYSGFLASLDYMLKSAISETHHPQRSVTEAMASQHGITTRDLPVTRVTPETALDLSTALELLAESGLLKIVSRGDTKTNFEIESPVSHSILNYSLDLKTQQFYLIGGSTPSKSGRQELNVIGESTLLGKGTAQQFIWQAAVHLTDPANFAKPDKLAVAKRKAMMAALINAGMDMTEAGKLVR